MSNKTEGAQWLDFQNPKADNIDFLRKTFGFHDVILREVQQPSTRTHVERYDDYVYFVYYFPVYQPEEQTSRRAEIDFLLTRDTLITVHYEHIPLLEELKAITAPTPFRLLYQILLAFFKFEERALRHIDEKVEKIGDELFKDQERDVLKRISYLKRDISEYRIIVRNEGALLNSLRDQGPSIWGEDALVYLNDMVGEHTKILNRIEDYRETILDFEETNAQLLNAKTTEVMKTFTAMSFMTFPFVLLVALFSMHLPDNPLLQLDEAFWYVLGAVILGMISLTLYFKNRDWL